MATMLALNCWIRSGRAELQIFQVRIQNTAAVNDLQEVIRSKNSALRDLAPYLPDLYKPKDPISTPYEENLRKLVLSAHGKLLCGLDELSEIFPEPPPVHHIHVIVDAPSVIVCWLRGANFDDSFTVSVHPGERITTLIPRLKDMHPKLKNIDHDMIRLYKVLGDEDQFRESLKKPGDGERLLGSSLESDFLDVPVLDPLRIIIDIQSPPPLKITVPHIEDMQKYQDTFLRVNDWGKVDESDVEMNRIEEAGNTIPDFVTTFQRRLLQKPHIPPGVRIQTGSHNLEQYFEPNQASTGDPQEEGRHASEAELIHTSYIAVLDWQCSWKDNLLKEHTMGSMIFFMFLSMEDTRETDGRDQSWPITLVVKREGKDDLRQYCPRSDLLISHASLPRLLVDITSTPHARFPKDLQWMLVTAACVVRFANNHVGEYSQHKTFVLCTFFISADGHATRYNLFQIPNEEKVYYTTEDFSLSDPLGRVQFARHLYNLRAELGPKEDPDAKEAVAKFVEQVEQRKLVSMFAKSTKWVGDPIAELRAHGYEVEPDVIVDDRGDTWETIDKTPDHIQTVYKPANRKKMLIAKKVWDADELKLLRYLQTVRPKSEHVIQLVDSFGAWAVFPRLATVTYRLGVDREAFQSKASHVCLGLVKGLAYLHWLCIAHRDINPSNLVLDEHFTLKIIDFDIAMPVEDADEEVKDQCGTERWMAPEVEEKLRHSPIKADRWSCGRVILYLLGVCGKRDGSLEAFAKKLMAGDPDKRPSLIEWDTYLAPSFLDSRTSGLHQDRVEERNAKRRRLD